MLKILHVEANPKLKTRVQNIFVHPGVRMCTANNIVMAVDIMLQHMPTLLITGFKLQNQTALHLKARLKMLNWFVPMLIITDNILLNSDKYALHNLGINAIHNINDNPNNIRETANNILGMNIFTNHHLCSEQNQQDIANCSTTSGNNHIDSFATKLLLPENI